MTLRKIGSNMSLLQLDGGTQVLFSYQTPVAARVAGRFYRTDTRYSTTTTRHINKWLGGEKAETKPQSAFNLLVAVGANTVESAYSIV